MLPDKFCQDLIADTFLCFSNLTSDYGEKKPSTDKNLSIVN